MKNNTSRPANFEDLKTVIKALNDENVHYILIGGYALYAHGFYRTTADIDILVPRSTSTGEKIVKALLILPDKSAKDIDIRWFKDTDTIRLADDIVVDIMFNASGETYNSLQKYIEIIEIDGIPVRTLNLEGLLLTKQTPREKDLMDKVMLKKALSSIKK